MLRMFGQGRPHARFYIKFEGSEGLDESRYENYKSMSFRDSFSLVAPNLQVLIIDNKGRTLRQRNQMSANE